MMCMNEYNIVQNYLEKNQPIPANVFVDYISKDFPDSCFADNVKLGNYKSATDEEIYVDAFNHFRYDVLNWCGCGDVEESYRTIYDYLSAVGCDWSEREKILTERFDCVSIYDNRLLLCFAYTMDAAGFTEHGTSIASAWLEDRGKIWMWLYDKVRELGRID